LHIPPVKQKADEDLSSEVTAAVEKAKNSPLPNVEELTTNVYEKGSY